MPHDQGKACIIVVNKWDAVEGKETNTMELQRRGYAECFSLWAMHPLSSSLPRPATT